MIHHVVSWTLRADVDRDASVARIRGLLIDLIGVIDIIRTLEVVENVAFPGVNNDLAIVSTFDTVEDVEAFAVHPRHVAAVKEIHTLITARGGIDWDDNAPTR